MKRKISPKRLIGGVLFTVAFVIFAYVSVSVAVHSSDTRNYEVMDHGQNSLYGYDRDRYLINHGRAAEASSASAAAVPAAEPVEEAPTQSPVEGQPGTGFDGQGGPWIEPNARHVDAALDNIRQRLTVSRANLERVREALSEQQRMIGYQNQLSAYLPSLWPAGGEVSSPYGLRWGGSDFHPGIDIANDYGTPIIAAASGTVTAAGWNSGGYGNMVDINHGNGIMTRYGHAMQVVVSTGQQVKRGQLIAYMGSTGFSTGPHVHYEVHVNGNRVNPISYL